MVYRCLCGRGELACLLGRNGAGKTTTILTVMGYLQPRPGRIRYNDRDIGESAALCVARLGFGFVPQERGIFPSLTVRENLTTFARAAGRGYWTLPRIFELFPQPARPRAQSRLSAYPAASNRCCRSHAR